MIFSKISRQILIFISCACSTEILKWFHFVVLSHSVIVLFADLHYFLQTCFILLWIATGVNFFGGNMLTNFKFLYFTFVVVSHFSTLIHFNSFITGRDVIARNVDLFLKINICLRVFSLFVLIHANEYFTDTQIYFNTR